MSGVYRPRACSHAEVLQRLVLGHKARLSAAVKVQARSGEPPVKVQPGETLVSGVELWLWSDGTLRQAPETVVVGGPLDRVWLI